MDPDRPDTSKGQPGIALAALFGLCPQCGAKTLYAGVARFAPKCRVCGLDFAKFDVGDGPAAFLILIIGALIAVLAIWVQLAFEPAYWVHVVLWVPLATLMTIGGLRVAKAALLASEYRNKAGEGRLK
ncbi:hypothetical protein A6F68_01633 [Tsuneonella dongtanensis]|uniref:DUF983 domain-containing protein n=1 Tax=Tsuneonella dongtanensis TaxID=692370 RepID=A0A1B2ADD0_9SPHN|nr:DUF983 domain-containing protein [Tsuneonella dongtanensis]ANY20146.1 hypothetical protein A6F68_01633 [Tsuneonella dongtanensis]